jgi:hypothetical protein
MGLHDIDKRYRCLMMPDPEKLSCDFSPWDGLTCSFSNPYRSSPCTARIAMRNSVQSPREHVVFVNAIECHRKLGCVQRYWPVLLPRQNPDSSISQPGPIPFSYQAVIQCARHLLRRNKGKCLQTMAIRPAWLPKFSALARRRIATELGPG